MHSKNERTYCNWQIGVDLLRQFHPLALFAVNVDHETIHFTTKSANEARDHGLICAAHFETRSFDFCAAREHTISLSSPPFAGPGEGGGGGGERARGRGEGEDNFAGAKMGSIARKNGIFP